MKRKWYYRIYAMIGGKRHLIWQYSKHYFQDDISKKDHKKLNKKGYTYDEHVGIEHSITAVNWVCGLYRDLELGRDKKDGLGHQMIKDGMFDPHFRLNKKTYPSKWVKIEDVKEIYFEMHRVDVEEPAIEEFGD